MSTFLNRLFCLSFTLLTGQFSFANSPATWSITAARNIDTYVIGQALATPADVDGPIVSASLFSGTLPPGSLLNNTSGRISVSNIDLLSAGIYGSSIRTVDALGGVTTRSISIRILPDAEAIVYIRPVGSRDEYAVGDTLLSFADQDGPIIKSKVIGGHLPLGTVFDTINGTVRVGNLALLQTGDWAFTIATTDQSGGKTSTSINFRFTPYGPLPVTLTSFQARRAAAQVVLNWQTASEKDNDHFEVERSTDGRIFRKIGTVQGNLTSSTANNYQFTDRQPLLNRTYYRLRQVDLDGTFSYSSIVWVSALETGQAASVFPNPTTGVAQLILPTTSTSISRYSLYDLSGRLIRENTFPGGVQQRVDLSELPNGSYLIRCQSGQDIYTIPLQKQGN